METWGFLATLLGTLLILLLLLDFFLTVLHVDSGGMAAPWIFRGIWAGTVALSRALPRHRRFFLAMSGPVMLVSIFVFWVTLLIVGMALIYWPHLAGYRSESEMLSLRFTDALYFSGTTATVLGYGDITPLTGGLKILAFLQSGMGFALLTGIVAYLLNIVSGVTDRNTMAQEVRDASGQTDGVHILERSLARETAGDLRERLITLSRGLRRLNERMHQFPILDLYYRSRDSRRDPEIMLRLLAETALGAQILSIQRGHERFSPAADELATTVTASILLFSEQYLPSILDRLKHPEPDENDRSCISRITERLRPHLESGPQESQEALVLAARYRIFFRELDALTGWRADHPAGVFGSQRQ